MSEYSRSRQLRLPASTAILTEPWQLHFYCRGAVLNFVDHPKLPNQIRVRGGCLFTHADYNPKEARVHNLMHRNPFLLLTKLTPM